MFFLWFSEIQPFQVHLPFRRIALLADHDDIVQTILTAFLPWEKYHEAHTVIPRLTILQRIVQHLEVLCIAKRQSRAGIGIV